MKYARLIEKTKRGRGDVYDGVILRQDKTEIHGIFQGPDRDDPIKKRSFCLEEFEFEPQDKETVESSFRMALLKTEKDLLDAEFEIEDCRMQLRKAKEYAAVVLK